MTRHSPSSSGSVPQPEYFGRPTAVQLVIPRSPKRATHRMRGVRGLRAQDHFLPLLISATLLTTLALVCIAYFSLRADVLTTQQQQVTRDVRIAQNLLTGPGAVLALKDGKLVSLAPSGEALALAGSQQADSIRTLTGERYALYQLQGTGLEAVTANGLGTAGEAAPTAAYDALVADCGPLAPESCHHDYMGTVTLTDGAYTAAFTPLFDANDSFIGALAVAQPQAAVLAPAAQFTVVLLFVGLLVTLIVLAAGVWTYNALSGEVLDALHLRLNQLAAVAGDLERSAGAQIAAAHRQDRMARQISEGAREIDRLVNTMRQGHLSMHESASGVWAEMSQPGVAPDPQAAMRFARQAVVMAAHVGVTTEDARKHCNHVVRLMNSVIAEGHVFTAHGRETERRSLELREVISHVERAIEEPLSPRTSSSRPLSSRPLSSRPLPVGRQWVDEAALDEACAPYESGAFDVVDGPLSTRLGRVIGVRALRWTHMTITRALDLVEWLAREAGARLPERNSSASQPPIYAAPVPHSDSTTRPAGSRERNMIAHWHPVIERDGDTGTAGKTAPFALPASQPLAPLPDLSHLPVEPASDRDDPDEVTSEYELPRLIDLTRHLDRFPDRCAQGDCTSAPYESSPGSKGKPAGEKPDDDVNSWRLP